jgi:hypothetical protein
MPKKFEPIDLSRVKTYPLAQRKSMVSASDFARIWEKGSSFSEFLDGLPNILAVNDIKAVIRAMSNAVKAKKTTILAMGAHVIKVGLNPIIIDMMQHGIISGVAMNGAGIIHDLEVALAGQTSEDVGATLDDGSFGMAQEPCEFLSRAIAETHQHKLGLGQAVGRYITDRKLPFIQQSILAAGFRLDIPVTVHVAIGTDILHMHPGFDAAKAGKASHRDFRIFSSMVSSLEGGVYLNVGSAVILPEIFLKAVTLSRNLGFRLDNLTTVNMDFIRHYRPLTNVVQRPTARGGTGINLVGHHEILLPLIAAGLIETLNTAT